VLAAAVAVVAAGVVAATALATQFDDATPCPVIVENGQGLFVCPQGTVDSAYSIQLEGRGCPPFTYSVLNGSLPAGISLSSSGRISGTPTGAGTARFWLQLSEGVNASCPFLKTAEREFTITVNPRVLVTTASAPGGTVGAPYSLTLAAAMKLGPTTTAPPSSALTWSVVGGQLAPGLALNASTGAVTGTPTTEGSFVATFKAALVDGRSDTKSLEILVRQPLAIAAGRPFAAGVPLTRWEVGVPFSAKLAASGGSGTYTWAIATGTLPSGFTLGADGTVSGTTQTAGSSQATLRLTDTEGRTADFAANFAVAARLAVTTLALKPGRVGKLYRARVTSTGGLLPKAWKITKGPLPRGVRFDRTTGVLSGTPTKAGRYRVTFQITDGLKVVATKTLRIDIADAPA
jgi:hypothetical protein